MIKLFKYIAPIILISSNLFGASITPSQRGIGSTYTIQGDTPTIRLNSYTTYQILLDEKGLRISSSPFVANQLLMTPTGYIITNSTFVAAKYYGDGSALTGIIQSTATGTYPHLASLNLPLTGGTLTGPLTLSGSSLTVTGAGGFGSSLGVGTISPSTRMEVSGAAASSNTELRISNANTDGYLNILSLYRTEAIQAYLSFNRNSGGFTIANKYAGPLYLATANAPRVTVSASGDVGLGTTAPDQALTVAGNISTTGQVISSGTGSNYFAGSIGVGTSSSSPNSLTVFKVPSNTQGNGVIMFPYSSGSTANDLWGFRLAASTYDFSIDRNYGGWGTSPTFNIKRENGNIGFGTASPASTLQIGTSLNATTNYLQIDTLAADTAGPPATADCDAATEVGRQIMATRYTATAEHRIWFCTQTGASAYAWKYLDLVTP